MKALAYLAIFGLLSPVRYGLVIKGAARQAAADWVKDSTVERGYCIAGPMSWGKAQVNSIGDSVWFVLRLTPAVSLAASSDSLKIDCGAGVPTLHTHPSDDGVADCNPSREDYAVLAGTGAEFSVLECGQAQFVFYFPQK